MQHCRAIDTSVIYPHPNGKPFKRSLKELASRYLRCLIQNCTAKGHDSYEDAATSMNLVRLKIAHGPAFGKY